MIVSSDASVRLYTGLPNNNVLQAIYKVIKNRVKRMNYWRGPKYAKKLKNGSGGRRKIVDHFEEYVLILVFIREGMTIQILADWFGISRSAVSCIIHTWINLLYQVLKNWFIWPSAEQVRNKLPANFPKEYADTRIILDCTEFFLVEPKKLYCSGKHIFPVQTS